MNSIRNLLVSLSLAAGFMSCTSTYSVHSKLVRPWSLKLAAEQPGAYPFLVRYEKAPKSLVFLAVKHENWDTSKSFKLIDFVLKNESFDVVLLEGFRASEDLSPNEMRKRAKSDGANGFYRGGETSFVIKKTAQLKLPFSGLEIDDAQLVAPLANEGFNERDILYFYFLRQLPHMVRDGSLRRETIESLFTSFCLRQISNLQLSSNPAVEYQDFVSWYAEKNRKPFKLPDISSQTSAPLIDGTLFTQQLSAQISVMRDRHSAELVGKMLTKFNRVLVIAGGSHWATQSKVFKTWLGVPRFGPKAD